MINLELDVKLLLLFKEKAKTNKNEVRSFTVRHGLHIINCECH